MAKPGGLCCPFNSLFNDRLRIFVTYFLTYFKTKFIEYLCDLTLVIQLHT